MNFSLYYNATTTAATTTTSLLLLRHFILGLHIWMYLVGTLGKIYYNSVSIIHSLTKCFGTFWNYRTQSHFPLALMISMLARTCGATTGAKRQGGAGGWRSMPWNECVHLELTDYYSRPGIYITLGFFENSRRGMVQTHCRIAYVFITLRCHRCVLWHRKLHWTHETTAVPLYLGHCSSTCQQSGMVGLRVLLSTVTIVDMLLLVLHT